MRLDTGDDRSWFDGLAWFNLGLAKAQKGQFDQARSYFLRSADSYQSQTLQTGQPAEWQMVLEYFATLARWSARRKISEWVEFISRIDGNENEKSELLQQLSAAAKLMLRYTQGEDVKGEAIKMVDASVSRTFLTPILLDYEWED